MNEERRIVLIDCDIVLWKGVPEKISKEESQNKNKRTLKDVHGDLDNIMLGILSNLNATHYIPCFTSESNFRKDLYSSYKANRRGKEMPEFFNEGREYMHNRYNSYIVRSLEADDLLSILARKYGDESIIATTDKDLDQVPGIHYNISKGRSYYVEKEQADYNLWKQVLMGDSGDNISGLSGIGPKKAEVILKDCNKEFYPDRVLREYLAQLGEINGVEEFYKNYKLVKLLEELPKDLNLTEPFNVQDIKDE